MNSPDFAVARLADLPPGGRLEVTFHGRSIALFRTASGVFATAAECPHRGGPLVAGWVENETVFCPLHGWQFDLHTGKCVGRAEKSVECYPVTVAGDEIRIQINPIGTATDRPDALIQPHSHPPGT